MSYVIQNLFIFVYLFLYFGHCILKQFKQAVSCFYLNFTLTFTFFIFLFCYSFAIESHSLSYFVVFCGDFGFFTFAQNQKVCVNTLHLRGYFYAMKNDSIETDSVENNNPENSNSKKYNPDTEKVCGKNAQNENNEQVWTADKSTQTEHTFKDENAQEGANASNEPRPKSSRSSNDVRGGTTYNFLYYLHSYLLFLKSANLT